MKLGQFFSLKQVFNDLEKENSHIRKLSQQEIENLQKILLDIYDDIFEACKKCDTKLWIRQVVVPGLTDNEEYITELGKFIKTLNNVEKVELLPYHLLGVNKYETMGIKYRLEGTPAMDKEKCKELYKLLDI